MTLSKSLSNVRSFSSDFPSFLAGFPSKFWRVFKRFCNLLRLVLKLVFSVFCCLSISACFCHGWVGCG